LLRPEGTTKLTDTTLIGAGRDMPLGNLFFIPAVKIENTPIERYQINYLFPISKLPIYEIQGTYRINWIIIIKY
jgi:hypothetical protein